MREITAPEVRVGMHIIVNTCGADYSGEIYSVYRDGPYDFSLNVGEKIINFPDWRWMRGYKIFLIGSRGAVDESYDTHTDRAVSVQQTVERVISRIRNEHNHHLKESQELKSPIKLEDDKVMRETLGSGDLDLTYNIVPSDADDSSVWSADHYDKFYHLTPEDIADGKIRLDAYTVAKVWKIGSKDDSGALFHTFKLFPRWGEKNTVEREIVALYNQAKALARVYNVNLEGK